ncbi:MAG: pesticidal protein Cry7Aa [Gammaproteobacteria bacterium]|jgi:predicted GH43/DUF377 family glycosyl hydrolase
MNNRVHVEKKGIILSNTEIAFENHAVLNPACIKINDEIHMFYRAINKKMISTIGYCKFKYNKVIYRSPKPILMPEKPEEKLGLEDPRLSKIDDTYYLTFSIFDGKNVLQSYATATELPHFTKQGLMLPKITFGEIKNIFEHSDLKCARKYLDYQKKYLSNLKDDDYIWMKNAVLLPKKFKGQYVIIHRMLPGIHIVFFDDFSQLTCDFWKKYISELDDHTMFYPKYNFENQHIAPGIPPLETYLGWIFFYHTVEETKTGLIYRTAAALLDKKNPQRVIGRLDYPLFGPDEPWEQWGDVHNVVFPSSAIMNGENIDIYYGAADTYIGLCSVNCDELLTALINSHYNPNKCPIDG